MCKGVLFLTSSVLGEGICQTVPLMFMPGLAPATPRAANSHLLRLRAGLRHLCAGTWPPGGADVQQGLCLGMSPRENEMMTSSPSQFCPPEGDR